MSKLWPSEIHLVRAKLESNEEQNENLKEQKKEKTGKIHNFRQRAAMVICVV